LVWDQVIINEVFASKLNADWLVSGSIKVGGGGGKVAAITVVDSEGQTIGSWDENGIALLDPPRPGYPGNPNYKMTLDESGLFIWDTSDALNPLKVVSITPLGIDAASITFGSARGGHNLVLNSSFELGAFSATAVINSTWDTGTEWNAAGSRQGADINITTPAGVGSLAMTAI
jgi:hypothetical protein